VDVRASEDVTLLDSGVKLPGRIERLAVAQGQRDHFASANLAVKPL